MDFTQVLIQIAVLFIIMFLGYELRRRQTITEEGVSNFSSLIFYATMPAMILASITETDFQGADDLGQVMVASLISYGIFILVGFLMPKVLRVKEGSRGLYSFMTIFGNVGFIGFPMLVAILDESAVFLGAVLNIPFNLLLFTIGIYYIVSDKTKGHKMTLSLKQFLNPGILATLLGLIIMMADITLPAVVMKTTSALGAVTTPLAMIVVGASLYGVNIGQMFKNYRVLALSLIRMLLFPLVVGLILSAIGLKGQIVAIAMVLAGMPIGTNTVIVARQYDGNVLEASEAVFMSTVLLLFTAPVLIWMIALIGH